MNLYSYVITKEIMDLHKSILNICTLATLKPQIREHVISKGDWVAGLEVHTY